MTRFDPADYPGARPDGACLVWRGRTWPLQVGGVVRPTPRDREPRRAAPPALAVEELRWSLAYGSNASALRLIDKGLDESGAVLLPATVRGWAPAWEARRSATGAVPVTLVPMAGHRLHTWLLGVPPPAVEVLDASEYRGSNYVLGRLGAAAVATRWCLPTTPAYGPAEQTECLAVDGRPARADEVDQQEAAALLEGGAPTVSAPGLPDAVTDGWPPTPLQDLPLLAYGTLQPGRRYWSAVSAHVGETRPATTQGRLWATPHGWPAGRFGDGGGGPVHGTLLVPASPEGAAALYREADRIEGELFERRAVVLEQGGWAVAYHWVDAEPPGRPLPDGRWSPDEEATP